MSKHHHHHHGHDHNRGCSNYGSWKYRGARPEENWVDCLCGGNNGTFLIFLLLLILAFSLMGTGGF